MGIFLIAMGILSLGGILAFLSYKNPKLATCFGASGAVLGCALAIIPALQSLTSASPLGFQRSWKLPYASFALKLDALSGFFLVVILGLSLLAALYGVEYMQGHGKQRRIGFSWLWLNLLILGMMLTVAADNAMVFILSWEIMTLASFFLVLFENEKAEVRSAGITYMIAAHIGIFLILIVFLLLSEHSNHSLDFSRFAQIQTLTPELAGIIFIFSVIGFGIKAGFMPFHVWLPDAHPAAPSHVSALMSGVMIKTGIYAILRILTFLGTPPEWWGGVLVGLGVISGVLGVWFALAQHDLKRLLAYHSVENIGIIGMGLGLGLLGVSYEMPMLAILGFMGGLLHVLNHAVFKGLLFLGAGAVLHAVHTREMDHLGGLGKKMPITSIAFLVGAVAICGLPPLNGFVSEFFIYWGAFLGSMQFLNSRILFFLSVLMGLALIGGLALACFTKAFSIVFLGAPRQEEEKPIQDPGLSMLLPMIALSLLCFLVSFIVLYWSLPLLGNAIQIVSGLPFTEIAQKMSLSIAPLRGIILVTSIFALVLLVLLFVRHRLLSRRPLGEAPTWDCGYLLPNTKMQYTSSSYAQPLVDLNPYILQTHKEGGKATGYFPTVGRFLSHTSDTVLEKTYRPFFAFIAYLFKKMLWLQHGYLHIYLLYLALILVALFGLYLGMH